MARRKKKNESSVNMLAVFPWWTLFAGVIGFMAMQWVLPSILARNPVFHDIAPLSRSFAWLPLVVFGCLALVGLIRSILSGESKSDTRERRKERRTWRNTSVNMSRLRFDHGWGITRLGGMQTKPRPAAVFDTWTLAALRALEWKRFELLCAQYYETVGFKSETIRYGADGTIDMKLFKTDPGKPLAVVQCKTWNVYSVGVKEMRELLGLMAHEKVNRGVFMTTGTGTKDALNFAGDNSIQLMDGDGFLRRLLQLPKDRQDLMLKSAFKGDYKTPTCPSCGIKMTRRESNGNALWGCSNYPKCSGTLTMKG